MKRLLKLFLIAFIFIFTTCNADASLYLSKTLPTDLISTHQAIVCLNNYESENSIACAHSDTLVITTQKNNKEIFNGNTLFKTSSQYKFLQEIYSKTYKHVYISKFHKISAYLKNEICTRAP